MFTVSHKVLSVNGSGEPKATHTTASCNEEAHAQFILLPLDGIANKLTINSVSAAEPSVAPVLQYKSTGHFDFIRSYQFV